MTANDLAYYKAINHVPLLDLRNNDLYRTAHLSCSTNISVMSLVTRIHELPDNSVQINLVGSNEQIKLATKILEEKSYVVGNTLEVSNELMQSNLDQKFIEKGNHSHRLWKPALVVKKFLTDFSSLTENRRGIDLACGSGRDSVYLAMNDWSMTSVDHSKSSLDKLSEFALRSDVDIKKYDIDLEKNFAQLSSLNQQFDAVVVVRYLHRPLLKQLKSLISPKGFIIYQTFLRGCEVFGSPKNPRFILEKGELAEQFTDFEIFWDEIVHLPDGRPTNCFIAQKPI